MATKKSTKKPALPDPEVRPVPEVGSAAPAFKVSSDEDQEVSLADFLGKWVVLYFYPRDNTPGCTVEACGFRDLHSDYEGLNAVVLGVSRDSVASHQRFKAKQELPFLLLADPSGELIASYGSWGEKTFMGKTRMGILRTTVIIDPEGKIAKIYPKVKTKTHAEDVKADLEELQAQ